MIKILALDDNAMHMSLIEQAITGSDAAWGEPVELEAFSSSIDLLVRLKQDDADCVILDRNVPDISGDLVLQWLRTNEGKTTSVIMLTSNAEEEEVVKLLSAGADDYLTKPFHPKELLARVQRLVELSRLRSMQKASNKPSLLGAEVVKSKIELQGFIFDDFSHTVEVNQAFINLTDREYRLGKFFFSNVGINLAKKDIMQAVLIDNTEDGERSLVAHVHLIREKLNLKIENGWVIRSIYGFGYRLNRSSHAPSN